MHKPRSFSAFGLLLLAVNAPTVLLCGCGQSEQITTYTEPKHDSLQTPEYLALEKQLDDLVVQRRLEQEAQFRPQPKRMIGVVIPQKNSQWFLKLEGNPDAVAARENDVREFLKSVRFPAHDKIEWELPTGWQQLPGSQMRYATLVLGGSPPLEMSVTVLPGQSEKVVEQVVSNINRWRGQLSLPPIEAADLDSKAEKLSLPDGIAYLVNIKGIATGRPMGMPQPQQREQQAAQSNDGKPRSAPKYDKPPEWTAATPPPMFSVVALQVVEEESKVLITITPARGNKLDNVNRWRGQTKLEPLSAEDLASAATKVRVGNLSGDMFVMIGEEKTIFGVIVEDHGQMWFVKLDGNNQLADRELPRFEAFLKSLRFE